MKQYLTKAFEIFGLKLIQGQEYDKLVYMAKHKPQLRPDNEITAMGMKKSLLGNRSNPVIFDVGAYIGQTVSDYLANFPGADIFAFEPTPSSFAQLQKHHSGNSQVNCYNMAISDVNGEIPLNLNEFSPTNSTLSTNASADDHWGDGLLHTADSVTVESHTLDGFCTGADIAHIDILKLDVQGAEIQVLGGATDLLEQNRISIVYLEVLFVPTYNNQSNFYEIGELLYRNNYCLHGMFNLTYDNRLKQADMLFYRGCDG